MTNELQCIYTVGRERTLFGNILTRSHTHNKDESDGGSGDEGVPGDAKVNPVTAMQEKLKELSAAHDLVIKNNAQLLKQIAETESGMAGGSSGSMSKLKEKLALFKLTSDAMAKVSVRGSPNSINFVANSEEYLL